MLRWKFFRYKTVAIGWLLLISILFVLPGSTLPPTGWFYKFNPDKWVHIGFFAILIFLWRSAFDGKFRNYHSLLLFAAFFYGLLVEFVQKQWVPNRSFDIYDVIADMVGSVLGLALWIWTYRKK